VPLLARSVRNNVAVQNITFAVFTPLSVRITCSGSLFLLASIAITVACADVIPGRILTILPETAPDTIDFNIPIPFISGSFISCGGISGV